MRRARTRRTEALRNEVLYISQFRGALNGIEHLRD
jgi:hypothetical protein